MIKEDMIEIEKANNFLKKISGQGLSKELGKYMWLTKAHTSQEAPTSISGSSSQELQDNKKIKQVGSGRSTKYIKI